MLMLKGGGAILPEMSIVMRHDYSFFSLTLLSAIFVLAPYICQYSLRQLEFLVSRVISIFAL